jgi:SAM-dependent methyltransferase
LKNRDTTGWTNIYGEDLHLLLTLAKAHLAPEMVALEEAARYLDGIPGVNLIRSDLLAAAEGNGVCHDAVFSGFAVHHLDAEGKRRLFRALARSLPSGGLFLMVDVVREEEMNRDEHVALYTRIMREQWDGIPAEALEEGCAHVLACDFPASAEELRIMAAEEGFPVARELCHHGFHRFFLFAKSV